MLATQCEKSESWSLTGKWPDRGVWATELGELQMERAKVGCHPSELVQNPDPDSIEIKREKLLFLTKNRENFTVGRGASCI